MFKDLPEGTTHYENDGCGEPAHNSMGNTKRWWEVPFDEAKEGSNQQADWEAVREVIKDIESKAYQKGREDVLRRVRTKLLSLSLEAKFTDTHTQVQSDIEMIIDSIEKQLTQNQGEEHE